MQTMIEQTDLTTAPTQPLGRHRCEVLPLSGDVQDDCQRLCRLLDEADLAGSDCLAILPVQFQMPKLLESGVLSAERRAAFSVVLRERLPQAKDVALPADPRKEVWPPEPYRVVPEPDHRAA